MKQWGLAKQVKTQEIEWTNNIMSMCLLIFSLFFNLYSLIKIILESKFKTKN